MYVLLHMLIAIPMGGIAQTLSLKEAVDSTLAHYPVLRERQADIARSRAHVTAVQDNRLPALNLQEELTLGTNNSLDGAYFGLGVIPSTTGGVNGADIMQANSGNIATAYLQWNFYTFGYYDALQKQALTELAASRSALDRDRYLLSMQVIGLYLDALKKSRLLSVEVENMRRNSTILTAIRAIAAGGMRPGVDSVTAAAAYSDARVSYLKAQRAYTDDKIALSIFTGLDTGRVDPDTTQGGLIDGDAVASAVPLTHPLLDVYQKAYETSLAANRSVSRQYLPKVGLEASGWSRSSSIEPSGAYGDLSEGWGFQRYNYLFGLSVTYNLFDLKKRHDLLTEGRFDAQAKEARLQEEQLRLDRMLVQANADYDNDIRQLEELGLQRSSAEQAYHQQLVMYQGGLNTLIDVTNALYVLRQSESNYVVSEDQLLQVLFTRAGLSNQLDTFLQTQK